MDGKEIKAVLFDLDGVLIDSLDAWYYVFNNTLKHFGLETLSKKEFIRDFGAPIEHDMKKYFKGKTIEDVKHIYIINFKKGLKYVKLFPQSIEVLQNLKRQKIKLGLITNSTKVIVSTILKRFKLKRYFKVIITMDDVKRRKPAPDMIIKAYKMLKVNPKNVVLVGDSINDIIAGRMAKVLTIGFRINADCRINDLKEIIVN